jgi:hypothetical protein
LLNRDEKLFSHFQDQRSTLFSGARKASYWPVRNSPATAFVPTLPTVFEDRLAEEIAASEERYNTRRSILKKNILAHAWDGGALFIDIACWMSVYFAGPYFKTLGPTGRYILHNIAMGTAGTIGSLPFVKKARLTEGATNSEANHALLKSVVLSIIPSCFFQPAEDWLIAISHSGSVLHFDFEQDNSAMFSAKELAVSFAVFGGLFGLIYYLIKKLITHYSADELTHSETDSVFQDFFQRFYSRSQQFFQSPGWESIKSGLQNFVFYLTDYFFDLNVGPIGTVLLNVLGCCGMMGAYSFITDSLPEVMGYLQIKRERLLTIDHIYKSNYSSDEPIAPDYIDVSIVESEESEDFTLITVNQESRQTNEDSASVATEFDADQEDDFDFVEEKSMASSSALALMTPLLNYQKKTKPDRLKLFSNPLPLAREEKTIQINSSSSTASRSLRSSSNVK